MAEVIKMPKMSDTMTEGVIAAWHKKVGDQVKAGDVLAEVETDKATMELESYETGTLLYIGVNEKDSVPVDAVIAVVGKQGEKYEDLLGGSGSTAANKETPSNQEPEKKQETAAARTDIPANAIRMPKMSDTMTEGTIVAWHKKVGDIVKSGELLAEVETDKATMELESYEDGTLLYIGVEQGNAVKVDDIIAIIGKEGTDYKSLLSGGKVAPQATPVAPAAKEEKSQPAPQTVASRNGQDRVKASPLARSLAKEKGIDIKAIAGSGENGRIVKKDVEEFKATRQPEGNPAVGGSAAMPGGVPPGQESFVDVPLSQMRKTIARRLAESMYSAPHFYLTMEINMDKAVEARKSIIDFTGNKISFNDMVIKAVAASLRMHPKVNSSWLGDKIRTNHHVHIGVAVAVDEGLLVPVVRFADSKSLSAISGEVKDLGSRAKNKQLQPADWEGSTFTISNLGMFGIEEFTAIINPPDACILAVGGIKETVVVKDGQFKATQVMKVTMSCDHRVVDGAVGAAFLQTLKGLLEDPVRILA